MTRRLSEAVVLYLGYGTDAWPRRDAGAVRHSFGLVYGWVLARKVKRLDRLVGSTRIDWNVYDLSSGAAIARERAAELAPKLSPQALDALAWAFAYDSK